MLGVTRLLFAASFVYAPTTRLARDSTAISRACIPEVGRFTAGPQVFALARSSSTVRGRVVSAPELGLSASPFWESGSRGMGGVSSPSPWRRQRQMPSSSLHRIKSSITWGMFTVKSIACCFYIVISMSRCSASSLYLFLIVTSVTPATSATSRCVRLSPSNTQAM